MSETDTTPKMFAKIIQIAFKPDDSSLYALDENGQILKRLTTSNTIEWIRCNMPEDNKK